MMHPRTFQSSLAAACELAACLLAACLLTVGLNTPVAAQPPAASPEGRPEPELPTVTVTQDNTVIDRSCRLVIPRQTPIADADGNGVVHIRGDGIVVECAPRPDSELLGDAVEGDWDTKAGIGFVIDGSKNVTLRGAHAHRFKCGIYARNADGLVLEDCDVAAGFAHRLRSTVKAEDGADWLWPHKNESNEWLSNYGAGIYVEDSDGVTIRRCFARRRQNGIVLDRVTNSMVYDNDCSFLSGWGLAMWRCTDNVVSRNAFDFCVRGHVEGVYNRGQDSAGILFFEQNSRNVIAENSATHGGDGLFGFAGLEALNGEGAPAGYDHARKGCNDNLIINNDFSYAPAHGIEMTFSFGNRIIGNRLVENAICGVWGGYSQDTLIAGNLFEGNGGMAYGLERGGVNIEHGSGNLIVGNEFVNNRCGVHLWWDPHGDFAEKTWGRANYRGVTGNVVARNRFAVNAGHPFGRLRDTDRLIALQLRNDGSGGEFGTTVYAENSVDLALPQAVEVDAYEGATIALGATVPEVTTPEYPVFGDTRPVGARAALRGRAAIIMTEWGPWDHESPMARLADQTGASRVYEMHGLDGRQVAVTGRGIAVDRPDDASRDRPWTCTIRAEGPGVSTYEIRIDAPRYSRVISGSIIRADWAVTFFPWASGADPRENVDAWRALAQGPGAVSTTVPALEFRFAGGGPANLNLPGPAGAALAASNLGHNHFGLLARTTLRLDPGTWRITTTSDDGVRVRADGKTVIDNWTWHGPTVDTGEFTIDRARDVDIAVDHFEIDGYAVLELALERVGP